MDSKATTVQEGSTFVGVFIPEDEQMEPYEVTLPADYSYHHRVEQLLGTTSTHVFWPFHNAKKKTGAFFVMDDKWSANNRSLNKRVAMICHYRSKGAGGETSLMKLHGPAVLCNVEYVDQDEVTKEEIEGHDVYRDTTLVDYQAHFDSALERSQNDGLSNILRSESALPAAKSSSVGQHASASSPLHPSDMSSDTVYLPLIYKPSEWTLKRPPKSLLIEYQQKYLPQGVHFRLLSTSPQGPFLFTLTVPELGREFTPDSKFASRSKKEAEHQASLLVLQYLKGSTELCGTVKEIDVSTSLARTSAVDFDSSWIDIHGDGGIMKKIVREGVGDVVSEGKSVTVHYVGRIEGQKKSFDSTRARQLPRTFQLGPSAEDGTYSVIIGLHDAISTMREQEIALVRLTPEYAYGPLGLPQIVPPASVVVFEVELCTICKEEEADTTANARNHLEEASIAKSDGNMCFANGQHKLALKCYNLGLASLQKVKDPNPEEIEMAKKLHVTLYCNAAAACIHMKKYEKVIFQTTEALKIDPESVKAYFRRAQAHMAQNDFDEAEDDFRRALQLVAQHDQTMAREIHAKLRILAQKRREHDERISHVYAKMFS